MWSKTKDHEPTQTRTVYEPKADYYTSVCVVCNEVFSSVNPCWNDEGTCLATECNDTDSWDGFSHRDGECTRCTANHYRNERTGQTAQAFLDRQA